MDYINISGAHFNPLVTLMFWADGEVSNEVLLKYFLSQLMGALLGIIMSEKSMLSKSFNKNYSNCLRMDGFNSDS